MSLITAFHQVALGDCCKIVSGSTPSRIVPVYWNGNINWFTPKDLSGIKSKYVSEAPEKITQLGLESCSTTILPPKSLLLSSRAPIGHLAINLLPTCTNQGFKSLIPNSKLEIEYLYYAIKNIVPQLQDMGNGATFKEISKAILSKVKIPLPPLAEQQKIAAILDAADSLRQKDQQLVERYTALSQSLFLEMFGDPVTNPKKLKRITLGEVLKLKSGIFLPASQMVSTGKYPVFGGNGVNGYHDQFMFESKQIIIGRVGVYCGCVHVSPPNSWITDNALYVSEQDSRINFGYLAYSLSQANLNQFASKSAQPLISGARLYPTKILLPEIEHQNQYIKRLNLIEAQKQQAQLGLAKSEALFNSLLQRAFTGELTAKLVA